MTLQAETWLEKNTIACPVGRVSRSQCQALRQRPTVKDLATGGLGWQDGMGFNRKNLLAMPSACEECKGWEDMKKKAEKKNGKKAASKEVKKPEQAKAQEATKFKTCRKCGQTLPVSQFYRDKGLKDGYKNECKECSKKRIYKTCTLCGKLICTDKPYTFNGKYVCSRCLNVLEAFKERPRETEKAIKSLLGSVGEALLSGGLGPKPPEVIVSVPGTIEKMDVEPKEGHFAGRPYSTNPAFDALLRKAGEIHDAKRTDYASNQDPLGNFREAERLGVSPLKSIMIRLTDKYTRACNLVRRDGEAKVKDESLQDTLIDLANYSFLAVLARQEERKEEMK